MPTPDTTQRLDSMETVSSAMRRLSERGYTEQFRAEDGELLAVGSRARFRPEDLRTDEQLRFEGVSDPDDEAILFALSSEDPRVRGTYLVPYGPGLEFEDANVVTRLGQRRRR